MATSSLPVGSYPSAANLVSRSRSQRCARWLVVRSCQTLAIEKPEMVSGGSTTCTRSDQPSAIHRGIKAIMSDRDTTSGTIRKPDVDRATVRRRLTASRAFSPYVNSYPELVR